MSLKNIPTAVLDYETQIRRRGYSMLGFRTKPFVVACIPAYNEEKRIARVILLAQKHVNKVIVCDDGSTDLTGKIARRLGAETIVHKRNLGYGASLRSLFNRARELEPDVVVTLDADGQHNPEDIPNLVKPILNGEADIVIGSRFLDPKSENKIPHYRRNGIKLITNVTKAASFNHITDAQSGYRAYSKKALSLIEPADYGMGASAEILLKAKEKSLNAIEVPVDIKYDEDSNSHNPISHGVGVIFSTIKYLSIRKPLSFYGLPGTLAVGIAMAFWVWVLQVFTLTREIPIAPTLVAVFTTLSGIILLTTSVLLWVLISLLREKV